ncbi:hypothetical protein BK784_35455 [Bacillus thuringiensis serovar medellin]|uniref:Secreted protein n=1 Tax=Bacillus thuringiensis subsp. medellin TaxID=79672 RepID=A0A9X6MR04_BACTV|nr:hypothetical protein [Bacillus thuringiensis]OUB84545.1 hypothetical protein BK784_35455 [Bacillus thuringiensis serovar medellin]
MFKNLVVRALATGIALTGGIGTASAASIENPVSYTNEVTCNVPYGQKDGKFVRWIYNDDGVYPNSFQQNVCGSRITWHLIHIQNGEAYYEGTVA